MPAAGQTIRALDFTTAVVDLEGTDETAFTSTSYIQGGTVCGVAFVAPTSGRVKVDFYARLEHNDTGRAYMSAAVYTGGTIGSGTSVVAASDGAAIITQGAAIRLGASSFRIVSGLTAGSTYNAVTEHRIDGGTNADIFDRTISVIPLS